MKKFNKMLAITAASILTAGSAYAVDVFESVEATGNVDVNVGYTSTTTEPSSTSKTEKTAYAHEGNSDMDGYVKLKGNMWGITLEHEDDDFTPKLEFTPKKSMDSGAYVQGKIQIKDFLSTAGSGLIDDAWIEGGNSDSSFRVGHWERDEIKSWGLDAALSSSSYAKYDYEGRGIYIASTDTTTLDEQNQLAYTMKMGDDDNFFRVVIPWGTDSSNSSVNVMGVIPEYSMKTDSMSLKATFEYFSTAVNTKTTTGGTSAEDKTVTGQTGLAVQVKMLDDALGIFFGNITATGTDSAGLDSYKVVTTAINLNYTADLGDASSAGGGVEVVNSDEGVINPTKLADTRIYLAYKVGNWYDVEGASVTYGLGSTSGTSTPNGGTAAKESILALTAGFAYSF